MSSTAKSTASSSSSSSTTSSKSSSGGSTAIKNGKGDAPRNISPKFRSNYDDINWGKKR